MSQLDPIPANPEAGGGGDNDQALRLVRLVWRGKWWILLAPALFAAVTYAYFSGKIPIKRVVPRYRATANLLIEVRSQDPLTGQLTSTTAPRTLMKQQEKLFSTGSILKPLSELPDVVQLDTFVRQGNKTAISLLSDYLRARADLNQDRLTISFESFKSQDAAAVVDAAIGVFKKYHAEQIKEKIKLSISVIEEQRDQADKRLAELQTEILALRQEFVITGDKVTNPWQVEVERAEQDVQEANRELINATIRLEEAETNMQDDEGAYAFGQRLRLEKPNSILEEDITRYQTDKQTTEASLIELVAKYGEDYVQVKEKIAQVEALEKKLNLVYLRYAETEMKLAQNEMIAKGRVLEYLNEELEKKRAEYFELEEGLSALRRIEEERSQVREDRSKFADRISQLDVTKEAGGLNLTVIDWARAGKKPVYPLTGTYCLYAAVVGLGLAGLRIALRGITDRRVWSPEEIPGMLGLSVVGVLPSLASKKPERVGQVVFHEPGSLAAEAVRSMRTATTFALGNDGRGVIALTSSVSGEGKSISCSNLALAFSQAGRKTLLVDADLRKPGQNAIFNLIGKRGLGDAIAGDVPWQSAVVQKVVGDLDLMPAGNAEQGPAELLESSACRALFAELRRDYDVIIVDTSPVLETAETRFLTTLADLSVFVMRIDLSTTPNARRAIGILQSVGTNLLGVFLNGASKKRGAKAYTEGISYGYGYGAYSGYGGAYANEPEEGAGKNKKDQRRRSTEDSVEAWS